MRPSSFIIGKTKILLDPNLDVCLAQAGDLAFLKARVHAMRRLRVQQCFLFYPRPSQSSVFSRPIFVLQEFLRKAGFEVHFISPERVKNGDYNYIQKECENINPGNKRSLCMFMCPARNYELLRQFICMYAFMKTGRSRNAIRARAVDYLDRPLDLETQDYLLSGFFDFLDQVSVKKTIFSKGMLGRAVRRRSSDTGEIGISIRMKLIGIISLIIFTSLAIMSYFTSRFFSQESEILIQENNLNLVQVYGEQISTELKSIQSNIKFIVQSLRKKSTKKDAYFKDNPSWFYIGLFGRVNNFYRPVNEAQNIKYVKENKLTLDDLRKINNESQKYFEQSEKGSYVAFNASVKNVSILGLTCRVGNQIAVVYLQPISLLNSFQNSGAVSVFMVNNSGDVIIHKDSKIVTDRINYRDVPIVQTMLNSSIRAGQKRYLYKGVDYMGSYKLLDVGSLGIIAIIATDIVFAPVHRVQIINLLIGAIVLCITLIIVFYFAKTIIVPIRNLVAGILQIEDGNFDVPVQAMYRDEIGSLTNSFKNMAAGLGEREKIKVAFTRFVNSEVVDRVLSGELKLGGERKHAAIFFSDLRGFTAMSEKMQPEEIVSFMNSYFTRMVNCINKTHGVVDKYIGDAIMAHWGAIRTQGNNTENAIDAGLMMRKELIRFNQENSGKYPFAKMGSGINTGPVISGQIGSEERLEYTIIGDSVNLASRIEALNKPFHSDLLISADSYKLVENIFKVEVMPAITVKGKLEPQKIYAVIGRLDDPECLSNLDEVREQLGIDFRGPVGEKAGDKSEEKFEIVG